MVAERGEVYRHLSSHSSCLRSGIAAVGIPWLPFYACVIGCLREWQSTMLSLISKIVELGKNYMYIYILYLKYELKSAQSWRERAIFPPTLEVGHRGHFRPLKWPRQAFFNDEKREGTSGFQLPVAKLHFESVSVLGSCLDLYNFQRPNYRRS